jgi:hypothetical protein
MLITIPFIVALFILGRKHEPDSHTPDEDGPQRGKLSPRPGSQRRWLGRQRVREPRTYGLGDHGDLKESPAIAQKSEAKIPVLVGAYISAAYFFTSSTSFANPAVTVARTLSDSFAGIAPGSVLPFIAAQIIGAALGLVLTTFINSQKTRNEK